MAQWGCGTLADRAAHDLFFNLRLAAPASRRCLLFLAFCGVHFEDPAAFGARARSSALLSEPGASGGASAPAAAREVEDSSSPP